MELETTGLSVLLVEDDLGDTRCIREMVAEVSHSPMCLLHVDRVSAALERVSSPQGGQIVRQHGGAIGVESQEGVVPTFTVRLPLACGF
jgi:hypothetical protein